MACNCGVTVQLSCPRHGLMGEMSKERTPLERAALELLEALKRLLAAFDIHDECDCGGSDMCAVCNSLDAIAKAEGRRE